MRSLQQLEFSGALLMRGYWVYVWVVNTGSPELLIYVGRTGDSSSANAQSPFNRLGQHLSHNQHTNALRRHLAKLGTEPERCEWFEMVAYGPIFEEDDDHEEHRSRRNKVAALEKALADAFRQAGYSVLNDVKCHHALDETLWQETHNAFMARFPKLQRERMHPIASQTKKDCHAHHAHPQDLENDND